MQLPMYVCLCVHIDIYVLVQPVIYSSLGDSRPSTLYPGCNAQLVYVFVHRDMNCVCVYTYYCVHVLCVCPASV